MIDENIDSTRMHRLTMPSSIKADSSVDRDILPHPWKSVPFGYMGGRVHMFGGVMLVAATVVIGGATVVVATAVFAVSEQNSR